MQTRFYEEPKLLPLIQTCLTCPKSRPSSDSDPDSYLPEILFVGIMACFLLVIVFATKKEWRPKLKQKDAFVNKIRNLQLAKVEREEKIRAGLERLTKNSAKYLQKNHSIDPSEAELLLRLIEGEDLQFNAGKPEEKVKKTLKIKKRRNPSNEINRKPASIPVNPIVTPASVIKWDDALPGYNLTENKSDDEKRPVYRFENNLNMFVFINRLLLAALRLEEGKPDQHLQEICKHAKKIGSDKNRGFIITAQPADKDLVALKPVGNEQIWYAKGRNAGIDARFFGSSHSTRYAGKERFLFEIRMWRRKHDKGSLDTYPSEKVVLGKHKG